MSDLDSFRSAWADKSTRDKAKQIAKDYVGQNREVIMSPLREAVREVRLAHLDDDPEISDLVQLVDAYREKGLDDDVTLIEMLLQSDYKPQKVIGVANVRRVVT